MHMPESRYLSLPKVTSVECERGNIFVLCRRGSVGLALHRGRDGTAGSRGLWGFLRRVFAGVGHSRMHLVEHRNQIRTADEANQVRAFVWFLRRCLSDCLPVLQSKTHGG